MSTTQTIRQKYIGTMRLLYGPVGTSVMDIRDIIDSKFDAQPPWRDFAITKTGFVVSESLRFDTQVVPFDESVISRDLQGGLFALAVLWQDENLVIHGIVWSSAEFIDIDTTTLMGECSLWPMQLRLGFKAVEI